MLLELKNVSKKIGSAQVLKNIQMTLESGHIYGLWGKNGSGKTMLIRLISGLVFPTEGEIVIDHKKLGKDISFPESIGVLIESPGFIPNYTGLDNLKAIASIQNIISEPEIRQALIDVGLDPDDKKKVKKYSLGMKQKLGIAAAVMEHPRLILLDEPTNALDEKSSVMLKDLLRALKEEGALIIISCHIREDIESLSDKIFVIEEGKITKEYIPTDQIDQ